MKFEYIIIFILLYYFYETSIKEYLEDRKNEKFIKDNLEIGSKIITKSGIIGEVIVIEESFLLVATGTYEKFSYLKISREYVKVIIDE